MILEFRTEFNIPGDGKSTFYGIRKGRAGNILSFFLPFGTISEQEPTIFLVLKLDQVNHSTHNYIIIAFHIDKHFLLYK